MAVPTTREQFKEYCLRTLGKPIICESINAAFIDKCLVNKYSFWYFNIIGKALTRNWSKATVNQYVEKHHYVPKALGGTNKQTVILSPKEHFVCHLLLTKMLENNNKAKMCLALHRLVHGNNKDYCVTSTIYNYIKEQHSKAASNRSKAYWSSFTKEEKSAMRSKEKNPRYAAKVKGTTTADKIGKANKGRLAGSNHFFFGKSRSEETIQKISATKKANGSAKGAKNPRYGKPGIALNKKWFNNGKEEKYFFAGMQPDNWNSGRLKRIV